MGGLRTVARVWRNGHSEGMQETSWWWGTWHIGIIQSQGCDCALKMTVSICGGCQLTLRLWLVAGPAWQTSDPQCYACWQQSLLSEDEGRLLPLPGRGGHWRGQGGWVKQILLLVSWSYVGLLLLWFSSRKWEGSSKEAFFLFVLYSWSVCKTRTQKNMCHLLLKTCRCVMGSLLPWWRFVIHPSGGGLADWSGLKKTTIPL